MSNPHVPLFAVATVNDDVLPETTDPDFSFDYVDISSISDFHVSDTLARFTFREAPSRARRLAQPGDIALSTVRTYLRAIAPITEQHADSVFSTGFAIIRPKPSVLNSSFLQYAALSTDFIDSIVSHSNGVSYPAINATDVMRFRIPLPPPETQQRIADYLDRETAEIDAAVADLDKYVELLEIRKKAKIGHSVLGGAEPGQRQLLNAVIGTIPSSWAVSKFSIEFSESNELNGDDVVGSLLSISELYGVIVNRRGDEGQQSSEDVSHYRVVHPGQLAANMMWLDHGGLGVSALHGHISPDYRAFDISKRISPAYAHYLLRSKTYVDHFSTISVGVRPNAKRTTKVTLGMTPIPIPPLEVQVRIVADLDSEVAEIDSLIADSTKLRELLLKRRSVLITEVVTGRKQV